MMVFAISRRPRPSHKYAGRDQRLAGFSEVGDFPRPRCDGLVYARDQIAEGLLRDAQIQRDGFALRWCRNAKLPTCSVTRAKKLKSGTIDASQK